MPKKQEEQPAEEKKIKLSTMDNGTVFCFKKIVSPVGKLVYTHLRDLKVDANSPEKRKIYRGTLEWGNEDELTSSPAYKPFMDHVKAFAKAAAPDKKKSDLSLPIREELVDYNDPESEMVWRLSCKIPEGKQPKFYDFRTREEYPEDVVNNCRSGDVAFFKGYLYYTAAMSKKNEPLFLVKFRPTSVWHVKEGDNAFSQEPEDLGEEMDYAYFGLEKPSEEELKKEEEKKPAAKEQDADSDGDW